MPFVQVEWWIHMLLLCVCVCAMSMRLELSIHRFTRFLSRSPAWDTSCNFERELHSFDWNKLDSFPAEYFFVGLYKWHAHTIDRSNRKTWSQNEETKLQMCCACYSLRLSLRFAFCCLVLWFWVNIIPLPSESTNAKCVSDTYRYTSSHTIPNAYLHTRSARSHTCNSFCLYFLISIAIIWCSLSLVQCDFLLFHSFFWLNCKFISDTHKSHFESIPHRHSHSKWWSCVVKLHCWIQNLIRKPRFAFFPSDNWILFYCALHCFTVESIMENFNYIFFPFRINKWAFSSEFLLVLVFCCLLLFSTPKIV